MINTIGTTNILSICKNLKINKLIFTSSFSVYGINNRNPIIENAQKKPQNYYGLSKLLAENQIEHYCDKNMINYIILRFDGIYGYGQNMPGFLNMCVSNFKKNLDVKIFNQGKQIRDQVYVEDAVKAILLSIKKISKIKKGIFNIGGGMPTSNYKIAQKLLKYFSSHSKVIKSNTINPNLSNIYLNINNAKKILGFKPKSIDANIKSFIVDIKSNERS